MVVLFVTSLVFGNNKVMAAVGHLRDIGECVSEVVYYCCIYIL